MLTIGYVTSRKEPCISWFFDSLQRECGGDYSEIRIVVVDFYAQAHLDWTEGDVDYRKNLFRMLTDCPNYLHVPPKPSVWQGPHRLTKNDYFAAASARNTAYCLCPDPHIVYVDDLSVLMPGWLNAVREAIKVGYICCGAFRKVKNIKVREGKVESFDEHLNSEGKDIGKDTRWDYGNPGEAVVCATNWTFGCSLLVPIEAMDKINGWPEAADSTGVCSEDCYVGMSIALHGYEIRYDRRMFTLEDEALHHTQNGMIRMDKGELGTPNSKSHALVRMLSGARKFDDYYSEYGGLRGLRERTLRGESFPVLKIPQHDWYDAQALSEL